MAGSKVARPSYNVFADTAVIALALIVEVTAVDTGNTEIAINCS
jgi:hypothetical protein